MGVGSYGTLRGVGVPSGNGGSGLPQIGTSPGGLGAPPKITPSLPAARVEMPKSREALTPLYAQAWQYGLTAQQVQLYSQKTEQYAAQYGTDKLHDMIQQDRQLKPIWERIQQVSTLQKAMMDVLKQPQSKSLLDQYRSFISAAQQEIFDIYRRGIKTPQDQARLRELAELIQHVDAEVKKHLPAEVPSQTLGRPVKLQSLLRDLNAARTSLAQSAPAFSHFFLPDMVLMGFESAVEMEKRLQSEAKALAAKMGLAQGGKAGEWWSDAYHYLSTRKSLEGPTLVSDDSWSRYAASRPELAPIHTKVQEAQIYYEAVQAAVQRASSDASYQTRQKELELFKRQAFQKVLSELAGSTGFQEAQLILQVVRRLSQAGVSESQLFDLNAGQIRELVQQGKLSRDEAYQALMVVAYVKSSLDLLPEIQKKTAENLSYLMGLPTYKTAFAQQVQEYRSGAKSKSNPLGRPVDLVSVRQRIESSEKLAASQMTSSQTSLPGIRDGLEKLGFKVWRARLTTLSDAIALQQRRGIRTANGKPVIIGGVVYLRDTSVQTTVEADLKAAGFDTSSIKFVVRPGKLAGAPADSKAALVVDEDSSLNILGILVNQFAVEVKGKKKEEVEKLSSEDQRALAQELMAALKDPDKHESIIAFMRKQSAALKGGGSPLDHLYYAIRTFSLHPRLIEKYQKFTQDLIAVVNSKSPTMMASVSSLITQFEAEGKALLTQGLAADEAARVSAEWSALIADFKSGLFRFSGGGGGWLIGGGSIEVQDVIDSMEKKIDAVLENVLVRDNAERKALIEKVLSDTEKELIARGVPASAIAEFRKDLDRQIDKLLTGKIEIDVTKIDPQKLKEDKKGKKETAPFQVILAPDDKGEIKDFVVVDNRSGQPRIVTEVTAENRQALLDQARKLHALGFLTQDPEIAVPAAGGKISKEFALAVGNYSVQKGLITGNATMREQMAALMMPSMSPEKRREELARLRNMITSHEKALASLESKDKDPKTREAKRAHLTRSLNQLRQQAVLLETHPDLYMRLPFDMGAEFNASVDQSFTETSQKHPSYAQIVQRTPFYLKVRAEHPGIDPYLTLIEYQFASGQITADQRDLIRQGLIEGKMNPQIRRALEVSVEKAQKDTQQPDPAHLATALQAAPAARDDDRMAVLDRAIIPGSAILGTPTLPSRTPGGLIQPTVYGRMDSLDLSDNRPLAAYKLQVARQQALQGGAVSPPVMEDYLGASDVRLMADQYKGATPYLHLRLGYDQKQDLRELAQSAGKIGNKEVQTILTTLAAQDKDPLDSGQSENPKARVQLTRQQIESLRRYYASMEPNDGRRALISMIIDQHYGDPDVAPEDYQRLQQFQQLMQTRNFQVTQDDFLGRRDPRDMGLTDPAEQKLYHQAMALIRQNVSGTLLEPVSIAGSEMTTNLFQRANAMLQMGASMSGSGEQVMGTSGVDTVKLVRLKREYLADRHPEQLTRLQTLESDLTALRAKHKKLLDETKKPTAPGVVMTPERLKEREKAREELARLQLQINTREDELHAHYLKLVRRTDAEFVHWFVDKYGRHLVGTDGKPIFSEQVSDGASRFIFSVRGIRLSDGRVLTPGQLVAELQGAIAGDRQLLSNGWDMTNVASGASAPLKQMLATAINLMSAQDSGTYQPGWDSFKRYFGMQMGDTPDMAMGASVNNLILSILSRDVGDRAAFNTVMNEIMNSQDPNFVGPKTLELLKKVLEGKGIQLDVDTSSGVLVTQNDLSGKSGGVVDAILALQKTIAGEGAGGLTVAVPQGRDAIGPYAKIFSPSNWFSGLNPTEWLEGAARNSGFGHLAPLEAIAARFVQQIDQDPAGSALTLPTEALKNDWYFGTVMPLQIYLGLPIQTLVTAMKGVQGGDRIVIDPVTGQARRQRMDAWEAAEEVGGQLLGVAGMMMAYRYLPWMWYLAPLKRIKDGDVVGGLSSLMVMHSLTTMGGWKSMWGQLIEADATGSRLVGKTLRLAGADNIPGMRRAVDFLATRERSYLPGFTHLRAGIERVGADIQAIPEQVEEIMAWFEKKTGERITFNEGVKERIGSALRNWVVPGMEHAARLDPLGFVREKAIEGVQSRNPVRRAVGWLATKELLASSWVARQFQYGFQGIRRGAGNIQLRGDIHTTISDGIKGAREALGFNARENAAETRAAVRYYTDVNPTRTEGAVVEDPLLRRERGVQRGRTVASAEQSHFRITWENEQPHEPMAKDTARVKVDVVSGNWLEKYPVTRLMEGVRRATGDGRIFVSFEEGGARQRLAIREVVLVDGDAAPRCEIYSAGPGLPREDCEVRLVVGREFLANSVQGVLPGSGSDPAEAFREAIAASVKLHISEELTVPVVSDMPERPAQPVTGESENNNRVKTLLTEVSALRAEIEALRSAHNYGNDEGAFWRKFKESNVFDAYRRGVISRRQMLAWLSEGYRLTTGKTLRNNQLMAVIAMEGNSVGLQIATGQGKTDISVIRLIEAAARGESVYLMTSDNTLVNENVESVKALVEKFGLKVAKITADTPMEDRFKTYQEANKGGVIVYGSDQLIHDENIMRDYARQKGLEGFSIRRNILVVDEGDLLALDAGSNPYVVNNPSFHSDKPAMKKATNAWKAIRSNSANFHFNDGRFHITEDGKTVIRRHYGLKENSQIPSEILNRIVQIETVAYTLTDGDQTTSIVKKLRAAARTAAYQASHGDLGGKYLIKNGEFVLINPASGEAQMGQRMERGAHEAWEFTLNLYVGAESEPLQMTTVRRFLRSAESTYLISGTMAVRADLMGAYYDGMPITKIPNYIPELEVTAADFDRKGKLTDAARKRILREAAEFIAEFRSLPPELQAKVEFPFKLVTEIPDRQHRAVMRLLRIEIGKITDRPAAWSGDFPVKERVPEELYQTARAKKEAAMLHIIEEAHQGRPVLVSAQNYQEAVEYSDLLHNKKGALRKLLGNEVFGELVKAGKLSEKGVVGIKGRKPTDVVAVGARNIGKLKTAIQQAGVVRAGGATRITIFTLVGARGKDYRLSVLEAINSQLAHIKSGYTLLMTSRMDSRRADMQLDGRVARADESARVIRLSSMEDPIFKAAGQSPEGAVRVALLTAMMKDADPKQPIRLTRMDPESQQIGELIDQIQNDSETRRIEPGIARSQAFEERMSEAAAKMTQLETTLRDPQASVGGFIKKQAHEVIDALIKGYQLERSQGVSEAVALRNLEQNIERNFRLDSLRAARRKLGQQRVHIQRGMSVKALSSALHLAVDATFDDAIRGGGREWGEQRRNQILEDSKVVFEEENARLRRMLRVDRERIESTEGLKLEQKRDAFERVCSARERETQQRIAQRLVHRTIRHFRTMAWGGKEKAVWGRIGSTSPITVGVGGTAALEAGTYDSHLTSEEALILDERNRLIAKQIDGISLTAEEQAKLAVADKVLEETTRRKRERDYSSLPPDEREQIVVPPQSNPISPSMLTSMPSARIITPAAFNTTLTSPQTRLTPESLGSIPTQRYQVAAPRSEAPQVTPRQPSRVARAGVEMGGSFVGGVGFGVAMEMPTLLGGGWHTENYWSDMAQRIGFAGAAGTAFHYGVKGANWRAGLVGEAPRFSYWQTSGGKTLFSLKGAPAWFTENAKWARAGMKGSAVVGGLLDGGFTAWENRENFGSENYVTRNRAIFDTAGHTIKGTASGAAFIGGMTLAAPFGGPTGVGNVAAGTAGGMAAAHLVDSTLTGVGMWLDSEVGWLSHRLGLTSGPSLSASWENAEREENRRLASQKFRTQFSGVTVDTRMANHMQITDSPEALSQLTANLSQLVESGKLKMPAGSKMSLNEVTTFTYASGSVRVYDITVNGKRMSIKTVAHLNGADVVGGEGAYHNLMREFEMDQQAQFATEAAPRLAAQLDANVVNASKAMQGMSQALQQLERHPGYAEMIRQYGSPFTVGFFAKNPDFSRQHPELARGIKGMVRQIQQILAAQGKLDASQITGIFDSRTAKALQAQLGSSKPVTSLSSKTVTSLRQTVVRDMRSNQQEFKREPARLQAVARQRQEKATQLVTGLRDKTGQGIWENLGNTSFANWVGTGLGQSQLYQQIEGGWQSFKTQASRLFTSMTRGLMDWVVVAPTRAVQQAHEGFKQMPGGHWNMVNGETALDWWKQQASAAATGMRNLWQSWTSGATRTQTARVAPAPRVERPSMGAPAGTSVRLPSGQIMHN